MPARSGAENLSSHSRSPPSDLKPDSSTQGCTTGFGKIFTLAALKRGDRVIATCRGDVSRLEALKAAGAHTMLCDVTIPSEQMKQIAKDAEAVYGRVDVVVNNAGYGFLGLLEEVG